MPTYDYRCEAGHRYERREPFGSPTEHPCEKCGRTAKRQLAAPPIVFKGSGWYVNDSRGDTKPGWGKNSSLYEDDGAESAEGAAGGGDAETPAEPKPRRGRAPAASSEAAPRRTAPKPAKPASPNAGASKPTSKTGTGAPAPSAPRRARKAATAADD